MKSLFKLLLILGVVFGISFNVFAQDDSISAGEQIFTANCAACHIGGKNNVMPEKTLEFDVLEDNGMNSIDAITTQVTNGKNAMPSFGGRLEDDDIINVAKYVLNQSKNKLW